MIGCDCDHSLDWHGVDGCGFPACACRRAPAAKRARGPRAADVTRCSVCNRRVGRDGGNHATGCERRGQGPNAPERPPARKQAAINPRARRRGR